MATYKEVQAHVKSRYGYLPKSCWIADIKASHGRTNRISPNRIDPMVRLHPCPPNKRDGLEAAMKSFGMV